MSAAAALAPSPVPVLAPIMDTPMTDLLAGRSTVGIAELIDEAALLTRVDRKYVVPAGLVPELLGRLDHDVAVLRIDGLAEFRYDTLYLDTAQLQSYLDAARGRPQRWKVRLRSYLDSGDAWFEVKLRDRRGVTVKHRRPRPADATSDLVGSEHDFVASVAPNLRSDALAPVLRTAYRRTTLLDRRSGSRITIDASLRCDAGSTGSVAFGGTAIVETKTTGVPCPADRVLWSLGHRPRRFSKYGTGLAALRDDLPANRWHQVLLATRRHPAAALPLASP